MRWFKRRVLFVSASRFGLFIYIHCLPRYTYDVSFTRRRKGGEFRIDAGSAARALAQAQEAVN